MIYTFKCKRGHRREFERSISEGPPIAGFPCDRCKKPMQRDWQADEPTIDTSGCKDHDFIPPEKRVYRNVSKAGADRVEGKFKRHIAERRAQLKDGNKGKFKQTHAIPSDLFHGKIRETGDRKYWDDPKNVAKHKAFKVSE